MKKFGRHKNIEEIEAQCAAQNLRLDANRWYQNGADTIVIGGPIPLGAKGPSNGCVIYNTFNGQFFGCTDKGVDIDSNKPDHDSEPWMQALLQFFYTEKVGELEHV